MLAFVFSGGGNRGGLEVGAIWELLEHGIRPDILVGSSAGAINAAALAVDLSLRGVENLAKYWMSVRREDVYPGSIIHSALRLISKRNGLHSNHRLYEFVEARVPPGIRTFGDIKNPRLYITAVDLCTGEVRVFGDDPQDSLTDAIMASSALMPYLPPWEYQGHQYLDGGVGSNLPLSIAIERGATEIYAVDLTRTLPQPTYLRGVIPILFQLSAITIAQQRQRDVEKARRALGDRFHYIHMPLYSELSIFDFDHTIEMIGEGRHHTRRHLSTRTIIGESIGEMEEESTWV